MNVENNCEHNHDNKLKKNNKKTSIEEEEIQIKTERCEEEEKEEPEDWKPQDKCYFCVDGKLLKVNEIGELVVESGPVLPDTELNKQVSVFKQGNSVLLTFNFNQCCLISN